MAARPEDIVTDHALVRYIERVMGLDVAQAKAELLGEHTHQVAAMNSGAILCHQRNMRLVVRSGKVVTVHLLDKRKAR